MIVIFVVAVAGMVRCCRRKRTDSARSLYVTTVSGRRPPPPASYVRIYTPMSGPASSDVNPYIPPPAYYPQVEESSPAAQSAPSQSSA